MIPLDVLLTTIFTDGEGKPIPGRPDPLPSVHTVDEWIEWTRQVYAYENRVQDVINSEFNKAWQKAVNNKKGRKS